MSPEEARDQAVEEIIAAGGSIISTTPMALTADPHTVVAYQITVGASDVPTLKVISQVKKATLSDLEDLIPYTPEEDFDALSDDGQAA